MNRIEELLIRNQLAIMAALSFSDKDMKRLLARQIEETKFALETIQPMWGGGR